MLYTVDTLHNVGKIVELFIKISLCFVFNAYVIDEMNIYHV